MITLIYSEVWLSTSYSRVSRGQTERSWPQRHERRTSMISFPSTKQQHNHYLSRYGISILVPNGGWRYMILLGGVVAIVQLICMLHMPESPVCLQQKGRIVEANSAFNGIRGDIQNNLFHFKSDTPPRDNHICHLQEIRVCEPTNKRVVCHQSTSDTSRMDTTRRSFNGDF